jgi:NADH-quinone oxidoreductase subunit H
VIATIDWVAWILLIARVVVLFFALIISVMLVIWIERKVIADMQNRIGPNRAGPFGILITLADGAKLFFKEGITPTTADRPIYLLAPLASMIPAFLAFAVVPISPGVRLFDRPLPFQIADLNIGILWILAMGSLAVYGVVLAGWASGSNYPLLGSIRSSAQMISYEIPLGLAAVSVVLYTGTVTMTGIVDFQSRHFGLAGLGWLPKWNVFMQFPAFLIYAVSALAETNRPPFDLPEAETELVAGYHTEYSGIKFAMFFLAEYTHLITVSAVAVTLFFGGWHGPMFGTVSWLWPPLWFLVKLYVVVFTFVWVRATVPRFRYDKLMEFGWKVLIEVGFLWVLVTAGAILLPERYGNIRAAIIVAASTVLVLLLIAPLYGRRPRSILPEERV